MICATVPMVRMRDRASASLSSRARTTLICCSAYVTLIRYAILGSPHKRLTLGEIYEALERRFPYGRPSSLAHVV